MRLTNTIKEGLIERAAHYIFNKRIEEAHRMAEEAMDKIVSLFIEMPSYKKNVEVYKNNKEYFRKPCNILDETFFQNRRCSYYDNVPNSMHWDISDITIKRKVEPFVVPYEEYRYVTESSYHLPEGDLENWEGWFEERSKITFKDEEIRKKFADIYIPVWNFCKDLQMDITRICNELASIMKCADNTTQLFSILPNMAKLLPADSGNIEPKVNEEINNLLN